MTPLRLRVLRGNMLRMIDIGAIRRRCGFLVRWDTLMASGLIACVVAASADPASAYRRRHASGDSQPRTEKKAPPRSGPLFAIISIADQRVSFYGVEGLVERSPVSTGQPGHRTPTGVFSIVQKQVFHRSNIYSGAPMPYMQRITWSGVAMHAGVLPGYPASHGCIRMPHSFAQRIYSMTKMGQRVLVAPHDIVPANVAHSKLPLPLMRPVQQDAAPAVSGNNGDKPAAQDAAPGKPGGEIEPASLKAETPAAKRLNPIEYAWAMRNEANAKSAAAIKAVKETQAALAAQESEGRAAAKALRSAESVVEDLERELAGIVRKAERTVADEEAAKLAMEAKAVTEGKIAGTQKAVNEAREAKQLKDKELQDAWQVASKAESEGKGTKAEDDAASAKEDEARAAGKALKAAEAALKNAEQQTAVAARRAARAEEEKAQIESAKAKLAEAKAATEARIAEARKAVEEVQRAKAIKDQELAAAEKAADDADTVVETIAANIKEATRRLEPVSVFISRKTGRLYVRQAFKSVFDVAVTIKEPERPIGTHVYVALDAAPDGSSLKWFAASMPDAEPEDKPRNNERRRRRSAGNDEPETTAAIVLPPESPAAALDRIEIPEAAAKRVAELAWIGASILISDRGMSGETGESTDFIVQTRGR